MKRNKVPPEVLRRYREVTRELETLQARAASAHEREIKLRYVTDLLRMVLATRDSNGELPEAFKRIRIDFSEEITDEYLNEVIEALYAAAVETGLFRIEMDGSHRVLKEA